MGDQTIELGIQTPIAAASALKKAGYNVTSDGKPVNVSENDDAEQETKTVEPKIGQTYPNIDVSQQNGGTKKRSCKVLSLYPKEQKALCQTDAGGNAMIPYSMLVSSKQAPINEFQTMLDVFPELDEWKPQPGGEVKDIKEPETKLVNIKLPKEVKPKKVQREPKMETIMTKKEIMEVIQSGPQPATQPSKPSPSTPTIAPSKPGQQPSRQNPFRPKPGPNPKPKGMLPDFLSAEQLGIGKNMSTNEGIMEIKNLIRKLI